MRDPHFRNPRVCSLRFVDNTIDCPACGPGTTAHLVIRESGSGIAVAACLGCRHLYPVEMTGRRSGPDQ